MRDVELGEVGPGVSAPTVAEPNTTNPGAGFTTGSAQAAGFGGLTNRVGRERPPSSREDPSASGDGPDKFDMVSYCTSRGKDEGFASFAFLLWGSENSEGGETWAVDVPLTDLGAEEKAMKQLAKRYREARGMLGSCFYLRTGVRMRPVQFRLVYRDNEKFRAYITGAVSPKAQQAILRETLAKITARFDEKWEEEKELRDRGEDSSVWCCGEHRYPEDDSHGTWCDFTIFGEGRDLLKDRLLWWETIGCISLFFRKPDALKGQKVLIGPGYTAASHLEDTGTHLGESLTYAYQQFYEPELPEEEERARLLTQSLRYVELTGLFVTDAWHVSRCVSAFVGLAMVLVLATKMLLGTWEAAFSAGSFLLAIPMLGLASSAYFK